MAIQKVTALQDDDGHWYVIPTPDKKEFLQDEDNQTMEESGEFDKKWGRYRTGGDLNLFQLYADLEPKH